MEMEQKDILSFQVQRGVSSLCKAFLIILEDLTAEYDRHFDNPQKPPENFLDERHFELLRKRILDKGGDVTRDLLEELGKYQIK